MSCERFSDQLSTGEISSRQDLVRHVEGCTECRALWVSAGLLQQSMRQPEAEQQECLETQHLLPWLDGSPAEDEAGRIARHVSACGRCLNELGALLRDLDRLEDAELTEVPPYLEQAALRNVGAEVAAARPSRYRWWIALPAAAGVAFVAIGLGLLLVDPDRDLFARPSPTVLRGVESTVLRPIAPLGASTDPLRFEWTDANGEVVAGPPVRRYRIVIVDLETGETRLESVTETTRFVPTPVEVRRFAPGRRYHWIVEPLGDAAGTPSAAVVFWRTP